MKNKPKFQYFNGVKFTRDDATGYYLNSTIRKRLHRVVYEHHHGEIPAGFHIHHKNCNRADNRIENLEAHPPGDHASLHWDQDDGTRRAQVIANIQVGAEKAKKWHASKEGRKWHSEHAKGASSPLNRIHKCTCLNCAKRFKVHGIRAAKYCSNACKSAHRRALRVDMEERTCVICGVHFLGTKWPKTVTCGASCRSTLGYQNRT